MDGKCLRIYLLAVSNWLKKDLNEDFIKSYNEDSNEGYFLEVDFHCLEEFHEVHNDLPFCLKESKLKKKMKNLQPTCIILIRNIKQVLNHGLELKMCIESLNFIRKHG